MWFVVRSGVERLLLVLHKGVDGDGDGASVVYGVG